MLFYVNAPIYLIILLENQVFIPDFPVGKLSNYEKERQEAIDAMPATVHYTVCAQHRINLTVPRIGEL